MNKAMHVCPMAMASVFLGLTVSAAPVRTETKIRDGFTRVEIVNNEVKPYYHAYMTKIDLATKGLRFDIVYPDNRPGKTAVLTAQSAQLASKIDADVVAGINSDFFGNGGQTQRLNVRNGAQVQTGYDSNIDGWGVEGLRLFETTDGKFHLGKAFLKGSVTIGVKTYTVSDVNTAPWHSSGLDVFTCGCTQKVPSAGVLIEFDTPFEEGGSIDVTDKPFRVTGTIASGSTVSSGSKPKQAALVGLSAAEQAEIAALATGTMGTLTWGINDAKSLKGNMIANVRNLVGVWLEVLRNGEAIPSTDQAEIKNYPRTCLGICEAKNQAILFVSDGYDGANKNLYMTTADVAAMLKAEGCETAVQFDGGGSTEMVVNGAYINQPRSSGGAVTERTLGPALFFSVMHTPREIVSVTPVKNGSGIVASFDIAVESSYTNHYLYACTGDRDYGEDPRAWPASELVATVAKDVNLVNVSAPAGWSEVTPKLRFFLARRTCEYDAKVEYLQSTNGGRQYIDTEYVGRCGDVYEFKLRHTVPYTTNVSLGSRGTGSGKYFAYWHHGTSGAMLLRINDKSSKAVSNPLAIAVDTDYYVRTTFGLTSQTVEAGTTEGDYQLQSSASANLSTVGCENSQYLFACSTESSGTTLYTSSYFLWGRMYYMRITNGGVLQRDFIPVVKGGVGYMLDRVSGRLFANGSKALASFVIGPETGKMTTDLSEGIYQSESFTEVQTFEAGSSGWVDPSTMPGETVEEKTTAAMTSQGFSSETASAVAGVVGGYEWLSTWATDRGKTAADVVSEKGVVLSAALGAELPLEDDDLSVVEVSPDADGKLEVRVKVGDFKLGQLDPVAEALLKSALGVRGAYTLGPGSAFSAENVTLQPGEVDAASDTVNLTVTPKAVDDAKPSAFFINIIAR